MSQDSSELIKSAGQTSAAESHCVIYQTWWHVEDFYHPKPGHTIRQVMDIATDSEILTISLPSSLFGLRGIVRSFDNREMSFIEEKPEDGSTVTDYLFSLPLSELPLESADYYLHMNPFCKLDNSVLKNLHRAKIEIEYSYTSAENTVDGQMADVNPSRSRFSIFDKHTSVLLIPGLIQPEFRITLPHGYTLLDKETSLDVKYVSAGEKRVVSRRLECDEPNISYEHGKERSTYYLRGNADVRDEYTALIEDIQPEREDHCLFRITYAARLSASSILMTEGLPAAFIIALIAAILIHADISVLFTILAAYIAYVCVYMSYLRDGFTLPRRMVFFICMILMIAGAVVFFALNSFSTIGYESVSCTEECCRNLISVIFRG